MTLNPTSFGQADYSAATTEIQRRTKHRPTVGLVLGSGLGPFADAIEDADTISYADIPNFPVSTAPGHAGQLVIGNLFGQVVVAMKGRAHTYEGYSTQQVTFPIRVMKMLGVERLILTNAVGGLNKEFGSGDLMLISDYINLAGAAGNDPTRGENLDSFGPRFTNMTQAFDPQMGALAVDAARDLNIILRTGVFAFWAGPSFETPSEAKMFRILGADAVGMSVVPETIAANHCGMSVLGISAITNMVVDELQSGKETTEEHVLAEAEKIVPRFRQLIGRILSTMD
jgi:purine-nucleoside phosphorylase